jgi:hypothetical protein
MSQQFITLFLTEKMQCVVAVQTDWVILLGCLLNPNTLFEKENDPV